MRCKFEGTMTIDGDTKTRLTSDVQDNSNAGSLAEADITRIVHRALALYDARHPRPSQVNQKQAAEMLGISARTVHNLVRAATSG